MKKIKKINLNWIKKIWNKKIIAIFLIIAIIVSILIWTFASSLGFIIGGGSTSVLPVMNNLTERYGQISKNKTKILYNGLGSASALTGVKDGAYSFGLLSEELTQSREQLWNEYKLLKFAFARDYIVLMAHIPPGVSIKNNIVEKSFGDTKYKFLSLGNYGTNTDNSLTKNVRSIYSNSSDTWHNIFGDQLEGTNTKEKITSMGRENGSGTKEFFDKSIIKEKKYYQNITTTSNGQMKSNLLNSKKGGIGYLSFDYVESIVKDSQNNHTYPICYKDNNGQYILPFKPDPKDKDRVTFNSKYKISRLFTGVIKITNKKFSEAMTFIAWMLDYQANPNNMNADYYYLKNGCEPLAPNDSEGVAYNGKATSKYSIMYYYNKYKGSIPTK